jgi:hypothetical protein
MLGGGDVLSFRSRLRYSLWSVQEEDRYFLVDGGADVHRTMLAIGWRIPVRLASANFQSSGFSPITILNSQRLAANNYGYTMKRVDMPGCGFARL